MEMSFWRNFHPLAALGVVIVKPSTAAIDKCFIKITLFPLQYHVLDIFLISRDSIMNLFVIALLYCRAQSLVYVYTMKPVCNDHL